MNFSSATNLNFYKVFLAVYETKNITRAGESLFVAPPTISYQIKELEKQLGAKLFTSHSRGAEPTAEGIELYNEVHNLLSKIEFVERNIGDFNKESAATIKMAMPLTIASFNMRSYIKEFHSKYPNIRFEFRKKDSFELLTEKKIDFVIGPDWVLNNQAFETVDLFVDEMIFVASHSFVAGRGIDTTLTKEQFLELPFIATKNNLKDLVKAASLELQPFVIADDAQQVYSLAEDGFGIGLYFKGALDNMPHTNLVQIKVEDIPLPSMKAVCAYNKDYLPKAADAFIKGMKEYFTRLKIVLPQPVAI